MPCCLLPPPPPPPPLLPRTAPPSRHASACLFAAAVTAFWLSVLACHAGPRVHGCTQPHCRSARSTAALVRSQHVQPLKCSPAHAPLFMPPEPTACSALRRPRAPLQRAPTPPKSATGPRSGAWCSWARWAAATTTPKSRCALASCLSGAARTLPCRPGRWVQLVEQETRCGPLPGSALRHGPRMLLHATCRCCVQRRGSVCSRTPMQAGG